VLGRSAPVETPAPVAPPAPDPPGRKPKRRCVGCDALLKRTEDFGDETGQWEAECRICRTGEDPNVRPIGADLDAETLEAIDWYLEQNHPGFTARRKAREAREAKKSK
jgi:hypothetical protein